MTSVRWNSNARRGRIGSRIAEKKKNIDRTSYPPYSLPHTHLLTHILHTVLCTRALIQQQAETGQENPCRPPPPPQTPSSSVNIMRVERNQAYSAVCANVLCGVPYSTVLYVTIGLYFRCTMCTNVGLLCGNVFCCAMRGS